MSDPILDVVVNSDTKLHKLWIEPNIESRMGKFHDFFFVLVKFLFVFSLLCHFLIRMCKDQNTSQARNR